MYSSFLCCRIYTGSGVDPHPNLTVSTILCISIGWNLYSMSTGSMIAKFIVANDYHLIQLTDFLFQWSSSDFHVSILSCCRICLRSGVDPLPHQTPFACSLRSIRCPRRYKAVVLCHRGIRAYTTALHLYSNNRRMYLQIFRYDEIVFNSERRCRARSFSVSTAWAYGQR